MKDQGKLISNRQALGGGPGPAPFRHSEIFIFTGQGIALEPSPLSNL